jgi:pyruvate dehydrogenase E1 component alpha subunit/2-oxoisovalerate dehydrogenase E1 component alpha subunit
MPSPETADRLALLRWMVLARTLDERLAALYRQGGIRGGSVFVGRGQEAFSAALAMRLRPGDVYAPLIRDSAGRLASGETPLDALRVCLGRRSGTMRGRDGNIHRGRLDLGQLPMISHLGAMVAAVAGALLAQRLRGGQDGGDLALGAICLGDGGMNTGAAHEGLNVLAVERLPAVVAVADNQYSYSTTSDRTYACASLADRAAGYGMRAARIDGTDGDACLAAFAEAAGRARAGEGPQLVVGTLLRLSGHGEHDDASYVPAEVKARFRDCVPAYERRLVEEGLLGAAVAEAQREEARARVAEALAQAQAEPEPAPADEDWSARSVSDLRLFRAPA